MLYNVYKSTHQNQMLNPFKEPIQKMVLSWTRAPTSEPGPFSETLNVYFLYLICAQYYIPLSIHRKQNWLDLNFINWCY